MLHTVPSFEPADGDTAFQKALLAAMAQTWRSAQATRKHASQNAILLEVSDVLIKTPSSLRKMVDQIHETAVERCKEGSLGTWGLWKFYLAALAERLKAGDLQVNNDETSTLCDLARGFSRLQGSQQTSGVGQKARSISFADVCAASNIVYHGAPSAEMAGHGQAEDLPRDALHREITTPTDMQIYEVGPARRMEALPADSEHLHQAAAELVLQCQAAAGRASSAAGVVHLHRRQAQLLRRRLDALGIALEQLLPRDPPAAALPPLQHLHAALLECGSLMADYSGKDWVLSAWRRNHTPDDFAALHKQIDACLLELQMDLFHSGPVQKGETAAATSADARDLRENLQRMQDRLTSSQHKDDPDRQERLYLQLATSYIICSKLDSGLASATPRTVIFDSNELEYGQYRGRGTFGKVHEASFFGLPVVVKILDLRLDDGGVFQDRLMAEARRVAAASCTAHASLVQLHGVHMSQSRRRFELVMERMHCSLAQAYANAVPALQPSASPLHAAQSAVHVLLQIATALAFLHERDMTMIELKPGNVMLADGDTLTVKLSDYSFSTARERGSALGQRASGFTAPELRRGQPRDNARANIYSLGAIGDELLGILSPTVDPDASHSGLRALQRLLTICQSSSPAARPPAHVVAYHLQLVKQLLLSVESPPELISTLASPKFSQTDTTVSTGTTSASHVPDAARDQGWSSVLFGHKPVSQAASSMADDDSAFNIQSHPDVLQAKREKRELKRQVTQLRSQLSQLQDILCDDDAAPVPPGADMEAAGEAFDSSSDEEEEEEPGLPLPGDIDNLNMPVEVVGADALVHAAGANRPAKQASAPMPAELQALPSETVSIKETPKEPPMSDTSTISSPIAAFRATAAVADQAHPSKLLESTDAFSSKDLDDFALLPAEQRPASKSPAPLTATHMPDPTPVSTANAQPAGTVAAAELADESESVLDSRPLPLHDSTSVQPLRPHSSHASTVSSMAELQLPVNKPVSDMGPVDAMLMMEAYSNLQRQNQKLQAKILSMNDVSDRLQLLEEHNRKLHKDNEHLVRQRQASKSLDRMASNTASMEVQAEAEQLRAELAESKSDNEQLTMDNIKLLEYLEKLNMADLE